MVNWKTLTLFAATSIIWGSSFLFIQVAVEHMPPSVVVFGRALLSAGILMPLAVRYRAFRGLRRVIVPLIVVAVLDMTGPTFLTASGQQRLDQGPLLVGQVRGIARLTGHRPTLTGPPTKITPTRRRADEQAPGGWCSSRIARPRWNLPDAGFCRRIASELQARLAGPGAPCRPLRGSPRAGNRLPGADGPVVLDFDAVGIGGKTSSPTHVPDHGRGLAQRRRQGARTPKRRLRPTTPAAA
jgi:EamA-like transporter family protein